MDTPALPANVLRYGSAEDLPARTPLRAGPLEAIFEEGSLRTIKLHGREVIRRIYAAVRDRNWGTIPGRLSEVDLRTNADSFEISFLCTHNERDIRFSWRGHIRGSSAGEIEFQFDGTAHSDFLRNRIGICVLHPARECEGRQCFVEHADGRTTEGRFPTEIAPHAPFLNIRAIKHEVSPGVWASVRFEGEIFEMEDQRNWIDASFKTFCTPLSIPFPVEVKSGQRIQQHVRIAVEAADRVDGASSAEQPTLRIGARSGQKLPQLGFGIPQNAEPPSTLELRRLEALRPDFLRFDFALGAGGDSAAWDEAVRQAETIGAGLEVALIFERDIEAELVSVERVVEQSPAPVVRWLLFHARHKATPRSLMELAAPRLERLVPNAAIIAGTNAYFTELNRQRPDVSSGKGVCYSVNPQVHAFDNFSIAETLQTLASTVQTARTFAPGSEVIISPVTFKPRFNPDATAPEPLPQAGALPRQADARQMSLFGAGWTLGALTELAVAGAHSVTFYETAGALGLMERHASSRDPQLCPMMAGGVYPLYHIFAAIAEFKRGELLNLTCNAPLVVAGLALVETNRLLILAANLTNETQVVRLEGTFTLDGKRMLNDQTALDASSGPEQFRRKALADAANVFSLPPYAVVEIYGKR